MPAEGSSFDVPPAAFGRYRVLHQIGAGSLGPVFRGEDSATGHSVAIAALDLNLTPEQTRAVAAGLGESASRVPSHPALAPILDAGVQDGTLYYVTPLVPGDSLDIALEHYGPAAIVDALPRLTLLAAALDAAAKAGVWHGVLQPRDVIVSTEDTTLVGVGVAQVLTEHGANVAVRTPYASPEALAGANGFAADQFALAAIAHEWLFGRRVSGPADKVLALPSLPGVDGEQLSGAFTTALAPQPADRFATTGEFIAAVSASLDGPRKVPVASLPPLEPEDAVLFELSDLDKAAPPVDEHPSRDPVMWQGKFRGSEVPGFRSSEVQGYDAGTSEPRNFGTSEPRNFGSGAILATLIVGLGLGMSAGYWVGSSHTTVRPRAAAAAPPTGQEYTDSAVPKPIPDAAPAVAPARPARTDESARPVESTSARPQSPAGSGFTTPKPSQAQRGEGGPRAQVGSLVVESRPPGARIVIDGRAVGSTPLTVPSLSAGTHTVRLDRSGYRPWATRVQITEGARARVAASLVGGKAQE